MDYSILDFLSLLGAVGLFLYGMKVMSEGLQKAAGDRLRNILGAMTRNRFSGLMTGFGITALIQSSSASTVMVVSFVNAGLMTLAQSMAVIMGANVGTTFTAWVIALFGFKVDVSIFVLPLIGCAIPLLFSKKGKTKSIGEFIIGFSFLFMGLSMISKYVPDLQSNPEIFAYLRRYASLGYWSVIIFLLVGLVLTIIIQSSAATFAIVLIMCTKGWITFDLACAVVLGSNIGTTITPMLAAMSGNVAAKRTAMGHLLFNVLGTIWCLCVFVPFASFNAWLTEEIGQGNPEALYGFVSNLEVSNPDLYNHLFDNSLPEGHDVIKQIGVMQTSVSFGLSIFHTTFNIVNVLIMIWFCNLYVKIVEKLVPAKHKEEEEFSLKFISSGILSASELNIAQAEKEIGVYAERVSRMIKMGQDLVHTKEKSEEFTQLLSRIEKYEDISDRMEIEIANYLNRVAQGRLSDEGKLRVAAMLGIISEIESIADCCYGIGKILTRKIESNVQFNEEIYTNIDVLFKYVEQAADMMVQMLVDVENVQERAIIDSYNKEREINNLRNQYRAANVPNINEHHYEYQAGIYYMDMVGNLEKTGDYIINVVDAIKDQFHVKKK
ncbi:MAG: Na/Pi cotransporter family protein [Bacteroidales bacterium]|nr:Na/Pi cotransporter family protein [Bacteroidales bacterium]